MGSLLLAFPALVATLGLVWWKVAIAETREAGLSLMA
jgi:hypothetical protein